MNFLTSDKTSGLNEELQAFEDSLALANRELSSSKEILSGHASSQSTKHESQRFTGAGSILEDADDLTRQIAEEVMKQNIGPSAHIATTMCNGDAEESIKAIARSLSNSGKFLTGETKPKQLPMQMVPGFQSFTASALPHSSSLPTYSTVEYFPPNVAIQNAPATSGFIVNTCGPAAATSNVNVSKVSTPVSQVFTGPLQTNVIPQNVTVTPRGIITSHVQTSGHPSNLIPVAQNVTIGAPGVGGSTSTGIITLPGAQQLTAQQLSALVQQAAAQLPPLPPYKPRQTLSNVGTLSATTSINAPTESALKAAGTLIATPIASKPAHAPGTLLPAPPGASLAVLGPKAVAQDIVLQHLTQKSQQEQLGQQQQVLAQQILQHRLAVLTQGAVRVTLPSTQNLGFTTILQQTPMGQLSQLGAGGLVQAVPAISQLIKTNFVTSQPTPVSLPTTNIVWTSPPNVTITTPNGLPQPVTKSKSVNSKLAGTLTHSLPSSTAPIKETFIDLTGADPPSYEASQAALAKTQPPPNYPSTTITTVTGKS